MMHLFRVILTASSQVLELPYGHIEVVSLATAAPMPGHVQTRGAQSAATSRPPEHRKQTRQNYLLAVVMWIYLPLKSQNVKMQVWKLSLTP